MAQGLTELSREQKTTYEASYCVKRQLYMKSRLVKGTEKSLEVTETASISRYRRHKTESDGCRLCPVQ
jgi:hypothetical protein